MRCPVSIDTARIFREELIPSVFTVEERERVRTWLLEKARADPRITGAAVTGSASHGAEDRWSDVDLFFGVAEGFTPRDILRE